MPTFCTFQTPVTLLTNCALRSIEFSIAKFISSILLEELEVRWADLEVVSLWKANLQNLVKYTNTNININANINTNTNTNTNNKNADFRHVRTRELNTLQ